MRPDIFQKLRGLDTREKLGFLQLQALVGMSKFEIYDKNGNLITLETDSHGMIRNTFQKLNELGYLQNYQERYLKDSHLLLPKLAFANTDIGKKTSIYNMTFQRTEKSIDFEDPNFQKMFPMVFSKRGILAKRGYQIKRDEEGVPFIDYSQGKQKTPSMTNVPKKEMIRESAKVDISLEEQRNFVNHIIDSQSNKANKTSEKVEDFEK